MAEFYFPFTQTAPTRQRGRKKYLNAQGHRMFLRPAKLVATRQPCPPETLHSSFEGRNRMSVWTILFVVLLIAWSGGFTVFHVAGGLIHLLLVFAVISLILHFVLGRRAV